MLRKCAQDFSHLSSVFQIKFLYQIRPGASHNTLLYIFQGCRVQIWPPFCSQTNRKLANQCWKLHCHSLKLSTIINTVLYNFKWTDPFVKVTAVLMQFLVFYFIIALQPSNSLQNFITYSYPYHNSHNIKFGNSCNPSYCTNTILQLQVLNLECTFIEFH